jgi:hypothetical protein
MNLFKRLLGNVKLKISINLVSKSFYSLLNNVLHYLKNVSKPNVIRLKGSQKDKVKCDKTIVF